MLPADIFAGLKTLTCSFMGLQDAQEARVDLWLDSGNMTMARSHGQSATRLPSAMAKPATPSFQRRRALNRKSSSYTSELMVQPKPGKLADLLVSLADILIASANAHIDTMQGGSLGARRSVDNVNIYTADVDYSNFNVSPETSAYLRDAGYKAVTRYLAPEPSRRNICSPDDKGSMMVEKVEG